MKKYFPILYIISSSIIAPSQNNPKAVKHFQNFAYPKVVETLSNAKTLALDNKRQLAYSYALAGNYLKAEELWKGIVSENSKSPSDIYEYAQVLKSNGKYEESDSVMKTYAELVGSETRVKLYSENTQYYKDLLVSKNQFELSNLAINTEQQDFGTAYYKDKIVFTSSKSPVGPVKSTWNGNDLPYLDLYIGEISKNGQISNAKKISKVNKKYHEGPASYSKNGSLVMFTQDNYSNKSTDGTRKLQILEANLVNGKWETPKPLAFNNKEYSVGHPALSADGNTLYFASDMPDGFGGVDLYKSVKNQDGSWGKPTNLGSKINTEGNEMFPFIHESGVLFFASNGRPGLGGLDIFFTKLSSEGFTKIINPGTPLNSSKDDFAIILNDSLNKGYFSSNREGGKGNDDIYSIKVLKPFAFPMSVRGKVTDTDGNILANTRVIFTDKNGIQKTVVTNQTGEYQFETNEPTTFTLKGECENYLTKLDNGVLNENDTDKEINLMLAKDPGFSLLALVSDKKSGLALEGAKVVLTDKKGNVVEYITGADGTCKQILNNKKLFDTLSYTLEISKYSYVSKTVKFEKVLLKPGEQNVNESLDLSLGIIELGTDVGKLININPIYFDLGKWAIRKDAAIELDKIVKVMNEYPTMVIELGSHTDCRASQSYNLSLSDKRAKSSAAYIISKGINKQRIYGKGYGESKLVNSCACEGTVKSDCSEESHQANRRTEFIVVKFIN